jgi:hypothetical protein
VIDAHAKRSFYEEGYFVARGLFDADEATFWRDYFTTLREAGEYPGDVVGVDPASDDPLSPRPSAGRQHG